MYVCMYVYVCILEYIYICILEADYEFLTFLVTETTGC